MECSSYLGWAYAHWMLSAITSASTASLNPLGRLGVPLSSWPVLLGLGLAILALTYEIIHRPIGPLKYMEFIGLSVLTGSLFVGAFELMGKKGLVVDVLITNVFIFFASMLLGFWDIHNEARLVPYIVAALVGQVAGQLSLYFARQRGDINETLGSLAPSDWGLSFLSTAGFALYVAYDTNMLKRMARKCESGDGRLADPIQGSMGMFVDILNLVVKTKI